MSLRKQLYVIARCFETTRTMWTLRITWVSSSINKDPSRNRRRNFEQALRLNPNHVGARFNRSMLLLLTGDFEKGWPEYEFRGKEPGAPQRNFTQPRWRGEPLLGKTILVYAEQGMGDTVQFIRFASMVKRQGATVLFESQPALLPLLEGVAGIDGLLREANNYPRTTSRYLC